MLLLLAVVLVVSAMGEIEEAVSAVEAVAVLIAEVTGVVVVLGFMVCVEVWVVADAVNANANVAINNALIMMHKNEIASWFAPGTAVLLACFIYYYLFTITTLFLFFSFFELATSL